MIIKKSGFSCSSMGDQCLFLGKLELELFLQKTDSVRRYRAFRLLLGQYLGQGAFPPGYRGWQDAHSYFHLKKTTPNNGFLFLGEPNYTPRTDPAKPSDIFNLFGGILLFSLAFISLGLVWMSVVNTGNPYTLTFGVVMTLVFGFVANIFWGRVKSYRRGNPRSFEILNLLFKQILEEAPPYDPNRLNAPSGGAPQP